MRYDNGKDWVEVKGVAHLPMRTLLGLDRLNDDDAHALAVSFTPDAHFTDEAGQVVNWREQLYDLTVQQWAWWKSQIWQAAREEKIAPEA